MSVGNSTAAMVLIAFLREEETLRDVTLAFDGQNNNFLFKLRYRSVKGAA